MSVFGAFSLTPSLCVLTHSLTSHLFCFHLYIRLFSFLTPCLRCDITAVLLYVEQLMWSVCESPEALVRSNPYSAITIISGRSDWPYQIHSLCEQLLTVLVIVTAPLSSLHRLVFTVCFCSPTLKVQCVTFRIIYWQTVEYNTHKYVFMCIITWK